MKEIEKRQNERDEKRHAEHVESQAIAFISKYYKDRGLIPLCAMGAMHNGCFNYSREIYGEFCCYTTEVQNKILEKSKLDLRIVKEEGFYQKCFDALIRAFYKHLPEDTDIFYDNGKYITKSLDHHGHELIPNRDFEYERRLTDVLSRSFRNDDITATPIKQLCSDTSSGTPVLLRLVNSQQR